MEELKYPIGKYVEQPYSDKQLQEWLLDIMTLPNRLEYAVLNLDEAQLQTPYRPGGWTVHQVVHHVADSHVNAYTRFKLGLTEDNPAIKPYDEEAWAELSDTTNLPVNISLTLLHALHKRLHEVVSNIKSGQWQRTIYHPGSQQQMTLWYLLGLYAWHGKHHTAHILTLRDREKWW
ncbi:YfiT family bacillithiol transferase [Ferruginibacter sp. HRS2-29]|uniref:YfiT family bacillithiol transferase n=1 Tax=Ferruginibacter sp. HRS2-29 TaxID=2487334 RepID=UPI0020CB861D|nr:putative metal-dependent hydrolase [Ferruginibacter sp. HRS2-29]MCP9753368.1 putative metal-dependent hydrolase [Ferruginibacter sp. HRS2-29]